MDAPEVTPPPEPLPPKVVSLQARRSSSDFDDGALSPTVRHPGRLERRMAGEFPILGAFQQFLEAERRRARQHALMLTVGFVVAIFAVVGVGLVGGFAFYRHLSKNMAGVQADLQTIQSEQGKTRAETETEIRRIAQTATVLQQQVQGATSNQQHVLTGHARTISELKDEIAKLEQHNRILNSDLEAMQDIVPSLSSDLGLVVDMLAQRKAEQPPVAPANPSAAPRRAPSPKTRPAPPAAFVALPVTVIPHGGAEAVPWRLLIPE